MNSFIHIFYSFYSSCLKGWIQCQITVLCSENVGAFHFFGLLKRKEQTWTKIINHQSRIQKYLLMFHIAYKKYSPIEKALNIFSDCVCAHGCITYICVWGDRKWRRAGVSNLSMLPYLSPIHPGRFYGNKLMDCYMDDWCQSTSHWPHNGRPLRDIIVN